MISIDTSFNFELGLFRQQFIDNEEPDESVLHEFLTGHVSASAAPELMVITNLLISQSSN